MKKTLISILALSSSLLFAGHQAKGQCEAIRNEKGIKNPQKYCEILEKIRPIVEERLAVLHEETVPKANFTNDLGADSLDVVELIIAIEEKFSISIKDEDAEKIKTIDDMVKQIMKLKG